MAGFAPWAKRKYNTQIRARETRVASMEIKLDSLQHLVDQPVAEIPQFRLRPPLWCGTPGVVKTDKRNTRGIRLISRAALDEFIRTMGEVE